MQSDHSQTSKAIKALGWIIQSPSMDVGVRELAAALNVAPSMAHRLLLSLAEADLVQQNTKTLRYSLGLEFLRIAELANAKSQI